MRPLFLAATLALLASPALAQTCTTSWTNAAGGAWETAANWDNGVPASGSVACVTLAGTYTVAQSGADRAVAGLVVGGASGTQTLTTFNRFTVTGNSVVRPSGRLELLNRVPGGSDGFLTTGTVTVEGVFVQNGGTTLLDGGGTFDVAPGGLWLMRDQASAGITARPGLFRLRGTLDAAYTSTQTIDVPLDVQGGTVRVSQGRLDVRGGALANATVDAAAGATLNLFSSAAAPFTVSGTLSGAPAGAVSLNGGTVTAAPGEVTLAVTGAGLLLDGNVVLAGGAFRNTGLVTVAGGGFNALDGTTLRNTGRFAMPGRTFSLRSGARLRNEAAGTLEITNGGGVGFNGGVDGRVENAGLLLANGAPNGPGSGATAGTLNVPYDGLPGSTIRTETGRLDLNAGGSFRDAAFDVPAGAALLLSTGAAGEQFVLSGTISGTPAGDLAVTSAEQFLAGPGDATLAVGGTGLQLSGSSGLSFTRLGSAGGRFVNTGRVVWSSFGGAASVVFENRGVVRSETNIPLLDGAIFRNLAGATFEAVGGSVSGGGRFENAGLITTAGAAFAVTFNGQLRSLPGSEIRALRGGPRLDLDAGSRSVPDGATISGTGRFLLRDGLDVEGAVSPGTAEEPLARLELAFSNLRLSLVAGSPRVVIDVDAGSRSDTVVVSNGARLAGALVVRVRPGAVPAIGDQWAVLTAASGITGGFSQVVAEGAPAGIAFVAERSPDGTVLIVRAVATAPGGPITVSTDAPVGGGRRTLLLSGPGVAGITAARLVCSDCLDAALGPFEAVVSGTETLKQVRFDLTSPRAFGFYTLVVQRPGQPDASVAVTLRPYISRVETVALAQTGMRVRPRGAPSPYNTSFYAFRNTTNGPAAFPFAQVIRPAPAVVSLALSSSYARTSPFYASDTAADPLARPLLAVSVPPDADTDVRVGLRIDPDAVLFPEQTRNGPDDQRLAFGEGQHLFWITSSNTTLERAAATLRQAATGTGRQDLDGFLAGVSDPAALDGAIDDALQAAPRAVADSPDLLADILGRLGAPAGLAGAAAADFKTALLAAVESLGQREVSAYADALAASPAVRALYQGELAALGIPAGTSARPGGDPPAAVCQRALDARDPVRIQRVCSCDERLSLYGPNSSLTDDCPPPNGPVDPNDKLADADLLCQFGTVTVGGQPETRCVRYFVPRAQATEPVAYTIKFENLPAATAPAEFVTITDTIDPSFDLSSLRILGTSSDSTFSYSVSGRTVTFRFVGIDLPPNVTAPEGEGFVRFSLRPVAGLPDGAEIRNSAGIVFDFNPPIATPEVLHEIRTVADLGTIVSAPDFVVAGNPVPVSVSVSNLRGDVATGAAVTISTGGGTAQAVPSAGTCTGTGPVTCTFGDLAADATATVELTFASPPVGAVTVAATATTSAFDGFAANDTDRASVGVATVGTEADPAVPRELTLASPWPNPARSAGATLRWGLPAAAAVDVRVYDLLGREVARVADAQQPAGWHEARWDARVASGVYVVRVRVGNEVRTRRITVVR